MQNFENYDIIKSKIDNLISKIWISELTGIQCSIKYQK